MCNNIRGPQNTAYDSRKKNLDGIKITVEPTTFMQ